MPRSTIRYILLFLSFLSLSLAASPTSFCKCTCFTNSTIIPLDGPKSSPAPSKPDADPTALLFARADDSSPSTSPPHARTCLDCTKQFCLSYNLPICSKATEDDVFTTCFQRDSAKDEAVVFIFIGATAGLLVWAGVRPWWERWRAGKERGVYGQVGG